MCDIILPIILTKYFKGLQGRTCRAKWRDCFVKLYLTMKNGHVNFKVIRSTFLASWCMLPATAQVFRVVLDEELGGDRSNSAAGEEAPAAPLAKALWEVVGRWTPELKRKFVLFCTGSDRLPLPGTELLRVELPFVAFSASDHKKMLGMLPQVRLDARTTWHCYVICMVSRVNRWLRLGLYPCTHIECAPWCVPFCACARACVCGWVCVLR